MLDVLPLESGTHLPEQSLLGLDLVTVVISSMIMYVGMQIWQKPSVRCCELEGPEKLGIGILKRCACVYPSDRSQLL